MRAQLVRMVLLAFLSTPCVAMHASALDPKGVVDDRVTSLSLLIGQRSMDDEFFWDPVEEPTSVEFIVYMYRTDWALGFETGLGIANDSTTIEGIDVDARHLDLFFGARKTFALGESDFHPYLSAGLSYILSEVEFSDDFDSVTVDDGSLGFYGRVGFYYSIDGRFNVGVDLRKLIGTDIQLEGFVESDSDFDQLSAFVGYSF